MALPDDSRRFLINPRGLHWSEIGPEDIVLVDEQGTVLQGRHRVEPTAMFIHAATHRITGQAVVLHTHMPYATALTLTADRALDPTLSQTAMRFLKVRYHDYQGVVLNTEEQVSLLKDLGHSEALILRNHGALVVGNTVHDNGSTGISARARSPIASQKRSPNPTSGPCKK